MKHIKSYMAIAMGGVGAILATGITGCEQRAQEQEVQAKGAFVVIEEVVPGKYKIKEEFPSEETRIILKKLDGTERVLTKEEMDALVKQEAAKIEAGTSALTSPDAQMQMQGGMSLGEVLLASAAGAIIGSWIGSKLFSNPNYQNNRKAGYKSPSAYHRSKSSFNKPRASASKRSGGFFGNSKKSSSRSFFGG